MMVQAHFDKGSHDTAVALGGFLHEVSLHVTEGRLCLLSAGIRSPRPP